MSYEMVGSLYEKGDMQQISEIFRKREIVIEHTIKRNDKKITNYIKYQLTNDRCELLNEIELGSLLKIYFNIKGRKITKEGKNNYYINLDVWKIESIGKDSVEDEYANIEINDFLPF